MMYASGQDITSISEKFGREPQAIRLRMAKMGVKRGDNPLDDQQSGANKPSDNKKAPLTKPWYLKSQRVINRDNTEHQ